MDVVLDQDSDTLVEISAENMQNLVNARLDRWAMITGVEPRAIMSRHDIMVRFSEDYPPAETGVYYIIPEVVDSFCARICECVSADLKHHKVFREQTINQTQGIEQMSGKHSSATSRPKPIKTFVVAGTIVALLLVVTMLSLSGPSAEDRQQAAMKLEREKLDLETKRLQLAKEARVEEERLMLLRQESERRAEADKVAQREADEERKREEARMDEEKARKKEDERNAKMAVWRSAANGSTPNDTFETLLNKLDSNGYTSDQQELFFSREGKDKWFVVRGPVHDVGTFLGRKYVTVQVNSDNYCDIYPRDDFDIMSYRKGQNVCFVGQYTCRGTGIMTHHDVKNAKEVSE